MELRVLNFFRGYVRIRITGSCYDRFLNLCAFHGILLWDLLPAGDSYEASISRRDFFRLREIVRKSHVAVRVVRRFGLPFFIHKYRKRKVYVIGIAAACLFMAWLSAHIWNISIEGNFSQTDDVIFEYLETAGIRHGMPKSSVDCRELAAEIRNYFTQFSWVAAEMKGTRLIIHVKEGILGTEAGAGDSAAGDVRSNNSGNAGSTGVNSAVGDTEGDSAENRMGDNTSAAFASEYPIGNTVPAGKATSLAASKSGTVVSIYVRRGRPLAAPGDEVEKGSVLVSGALPVYNDSGEISSWQYVNADADIVIRSQVSYRDTVKYQNTQKQFTGREKRRYLLRICGWPFALPGSAKPYETCTVAGEQTQLRLTDNFYLPLYLEKFTAKEYENQEIIYTKEEIREILRSNLKYFMKNLEEKGVQIFENDVKIEWNDKSATAAGTLTVGECAVDEVAAGTDDLPQM